MATFREKNIKDNNTTMEKNLIEINLYKFY